MFTCMFKRVTKFNWVLEPSKFLSQGEAKKLLETARDRAGVAFANMRKIPASLDLQIPARAC